MNEVVKGRNFVNNKVAKLSHSKGTKRVSWLNSRRYSNI